MTLFSKEAKPEKIANASLAYDNFVEYKSEDDEQLSIEEYFQNIRPYLRDTINDLRKSGKWEIQFKLKTTFVIKREW